MVTLVGTVDQKFLSSRYYRFGARTRYIDRVFCHQGRHENVSTTAALCLLCVLLFLCLSSLWILTLRIYRWQRAVVDAKGTPSSPEIPARTKNAQWLFDRALVSRTRYAPRTCSSIADKSFPPFCFPHLASPLNSLRPMGSPGSNVSVYIV